MSSTSAASIQQHFSDLTDPRTRKVTYPLVNVVTMSLCAVLGGADDKASLRDAVARSTPRLAATELMKTAERNRIVHQTIERASQHPKTRSPELPQVAYGY